MKYPVAQTIHHLLPKSIGGSNNESNLRKVNDNFHRAFHRVFENRSPVGQIAMLTDFNAPALTLDFCARVNELLKDAQDLDFVYKQGILVPKGEFIKSYK